MPFIYKLVGGGDEVYIGSTTQSLKTRLSEHKYDLKKIYMICSSRILFEKYGLDAVRIEMLEEVAEDDMLLREKFHILNTPNVVNKVVPLQTEEERKDYEKKYREEHREIISKKMKVYREENMEYFAERNRNYYAENREKILEQKKKYSEKNKDDIKKKHGVKYDCECGGKYTHNNKSKHIKTPKHLTWLETA